MIDGALPTRVVSVGAAVIALFAVSPVRAQERATEQSSLVHVFDETPVWETDADLIEVPLEAPAELTICRQGRIVTTGSGREAHMGCWPRDGSGRSVLRVPSGTAYLAVHRAVEDLSWIGDGAVELHEGSSLHVRFDDHLPIRIAGWIFGGVALVGAIVCLALSAVVGPIAGTVRYTDVPLAVSGGVLAGLMLVVGIPLVAWGDSTTLVDEASAGTSSPEPAPQSPPPASPPSP